MNEAIRSKRLTRQLSHACHSEAPVLWGPKNPCSFFEWPDY